MCSVELRNHFTLNKNHWSQRKRCSIAWAQPRPFDPKPTVCVKCWTTGSTLGLRRPNSGVVLAVDRKSRSCTYLVRECCILKFLVIVPYNQLCYCDTADIEARTVVLVNRLLRVTFVHNVSITASMWSLWSYLWRYHFIVIRIQFITMPVITIYWI